MMTLECYECGSYEIRFVNVTAGGRRVYVFACKEHGTSKDVWEPIDARQMQEIGLQIELGRDFPPRNQS